MNNINNLIRSKNYNDQTDLCKIMKESGSDKSSDWHNYTPLYNFLFQTLRKESINFFELGILFGSSIRGWCKYFAKANIFAADVDQSYLINDERVKSFVCDQDDVKSIERLWSNFDHDNFFDIMVEDGKHEYTSNVNFLKNSIHMLKKGGIFIIEDLTHSTKQAFSYTLSQLKNDLDVEEILILDIPNDNNKIDNCLLLIRK